MKDFAAIDFETANEQLSSICSVGVVIVRDGEVAGTYYSLIHPEPDYYRPGNIRVHGITPDDTDQARVFPYVWKEIEPLVGHLPLIAHNKGFDEECLKAAFKTYCMDYPDYPFYCTLKASRKAFRNLPNHRLDTVAAYCGYHLLNHHNALADAEACAHIALEILSEKALFS